MYIATVPNRNSPPAILLREGYRENGKVKTRTLANLSHLPPHAIDLLRRSLKGEQLAPVAPSFEAIASAHHGHVHAVLLAMRRLGIANLIASRPSRERDLAVAMVAARVLEPDSKLATTRWWNTTTLPEQLGVSDADEDDLYAAMDWVLERQGEVERKLAARHLEEGGLALYDLSSSYVEGAHCPLAAFGYSRDRKKGKRQVNYGLLTNRQGCPVSISVYSGKTADPQTVQSQVEQLRTVFGITKMVFVGDRGMVSQKQIEQWSGVDGLDWITALRSEAVRGLVATGAIQLGLFAERGLFEFTHEDFPGERLVACRNPALRQLRARKRQELLGATTGELEQVRSMVQRGSLKGEGRIGVRVGRVVNKYQMAKHVVLDIREDSFDFHVDQAAVAAEAALDGIYVLRTSVPEERLSTEDVVRSYKRLTDVERAFRSLKGIDLRVRPIHHRLEKRVRAHIFLCMLAYYVEWHMREAWRPLLFADEDQEAKQGRDPVAPATRSDAALRKVRAHQLEDGSEAHSFRTLLKFLSTIVRNVCRVPGADAPTFEVLTTPNSTQQRAYDLLQTISV